MYEKRTLFVRSVLCRFPVYEKRTLFVGVYYVDTLCMRNVRYL